jgi:outer membrane lipoprotein-sorting protein
MSIFDRRPALRWLTPLAFVAVVGGSTGLYATATATQPLKQMSAQQLLVKMQEAKVDGLSGTIQQTSDLGLSLPGLGGSDDAKLSSLAAGTHTLDVWYSGPDKARLRVQGTFDESDVIHNGKDLWNWSYKDKTVTHRTLSAPDQADAKKPTMPADLPKTPQEAAKAALAAVDSTTKVTTSKSSKVAGRAAYELVLAPQDEGSLIAQVRIAVDAKKFIPLRLDVIATDDTPVFEVAYTKIDFNRPDDGQFTFTTPEGTTVKNVAPDKAPSKAQLKAHSKRAASPAATAKPKVYGKGWSSVVVTKMPAGNADQATGQLGQVLNSLPKVLGGKGRLLSSKAFSAVLMDDGRVAVGAVKPDLLYAALQ